MDVRDALSLYDLSKIARDVDKGIKSIEQELRHPERLLFSKTQERRDVAEKELESIAKDVLDFKSELTTDIEEIVTSSEWFKEANNSYQQLFEDIYQVLKQLEDQFKEHGYVPYNYPNRENEANGCNINDLSIKPDELIENISLVSNSQATPDNTFILQRFHPSLNSSLIHMGRENISAEIFDSSDLDGCKIGHLKLNENGQTPARREHRIPLTLLSTPEDPGCSMLSLEVTGRSVRHLRHLKPRF